MTPNMLRQFWSLVETTQASLLLSLDDRSLVQWLVRQLETPELLDRCQIDLYHQYIHAKLPLIRDLAGQRHEFPARC
ncbi:MAG: hypothetical protein HC890_10220 [Chloroflexaceae bacterium]|nr:hypothetical protein [Chloroflexaceae bacterium]